jgi:hypothetical protein
MTDVHRRAALIIGGAALLAAASPTIAGAVKTAEQVIVANTADQPVPTKAIGTTNVAGTVNVAGKPNVAVPDGVAINGTPTVEVDDSTPVAVAPAAPERVVLAVERFAEAGSGEQCSKLPDPPAGKQYAIDAFQLELTTTGNPPGQNGYVLDVESNGSGGISLFRFTGDWLERGAERYSARIEGPFVHDGTTHSLSACASGFGGNDARVRGVALGTLVPAS